MKKEKAVKFMCGGYDVLLTNGILLSFFRYANDLNHYSFEYGCESEDLRREDLVSIKKAIEKTLAIKPE